MATASTASPRATAGRMALRCASLPASSMVSAPSTPELKNGPGTGPRPSSSNSTAASVSVLPLPPYSVGIRMPEPAGVDGLAPEVGHQARLLLLQRDERVGRRLPLDERPCGRAQHLL